MIKTGQIYKILESDSKRYHMFTDTGNEICDQLSKKVCQQILNGELTIDEAVSEINEEIGNIAEEHQEINDSEPRAQFRYEIQEAFREIGSDPKEFWL